MKTCIPKEISEKLKESLKKGEVDPSVLLKMLPEEKEALKTLLRDYVAEKYGLGAKTTEIKTISEKAKKIDSAYQKLGQDLGNPSKLQENVDYFKAKKEMDDYLQSLNPSSKTKVATSTIGRGMMLFSVKSPILNIGSNIEIGVTEAISRRLSDFRFKGTDGKLARDYIKMVNNIYQKTGYDISRMESIKDPETGGGRFLGAYTHSQGKGFIRKVGRGVEDIVFKQLMGAPDVAFSSLHFADSVNVNSLKVAKGNKTKAKEIMIDSMRLEPQTPDGLIVRGQGILDAQTATWTNKTWASDISIGIRNLINKAGGDIGIGDYLLPFVKTPANVYATGMEYAGKGIYDAVRKIFRGLKTGELGSKMYWTKIIRGLVKSGLGMTLAYFITKQLDDDDFMGAYDPKRAQIEQLRNSTSNSFRVGNKWVSTAWLGPLMIPVTAMMYARKYGDTKAEKAFQYGKGVLSTVLMIPGIADIVDEVKTQSYKKNQSLEEMSSSTIDFITSEVYSRLVPSIFSDVAKIIDPYARQGGKGFQGVKAKMPIVSKTLPIKTNIFGEQIRGEGVLTDLFFGARVKTDKETALIKEISRVSLATDKGITFTDWAKSSSQSLAQFKAKVGEERFNQAKLMYGRELKRELEMTFAKPAYIKLSNEDKLKVINAKDTEVMNKIFKIYGFRYKSLPSTIPKNL